MPERGNDMAYYRRSSWTNASNGAVAIKQTQRHVTLHYPGFGSNSVKTANWSRQQCLNQIASWRKMHVPSAYREIAYNFFALPTGDFVEGRGLRQNGANGTSAANRAGLSIQVLVGDNEKLTAGHIKAVNDCLAYIRKHHASATGTLYGHQHWVSTRCPGPYVMAALKAGTFGAGKGSAGGAVQPWEKSPRIQGMSKAEVKRIQQMLVDANNNIGKSGVDGSYKADTFNAVKRVQKALGLTADGVFGPDTEKALAKHLEGMGKKPKPAPKPKPKPKPAASGKLVEDGRWGTATTSALQRLLNSKTGSKLKVDGRTGPETWKALQRHLGHPVVDGLIEHQSYKPEELGNGISPNGWRYTGRKSKGSKTVRRLQARVGVAQDGVVYEGTTKALQRAINSGKF